MPRDNQISIDGGLDRFACMSCDERIFTSESALLQHCRKATCHQGEWCERCTWLFVSQSAYQAHRRDSDVHWVCSKCGCDESEKDRLISHMSESHLYCFEYCEQEFDNENNLQMHKQIHLPRSKECHGCTRKFATVSAMMLHLESDTCPSGITLGDIDQWAFGCYQSRYYTNEWDDEYKYKCPTCGNEFEFVSGLFQHIESPSCD
ncbi:uncharacterized protein A1O9_05262, partial [Exophiala aquamarina CBS 119918]